MYCSWKKYIFCLSALLITSQANYAQFAPAAGLPGSTAIWKDSSVFVEWASGCTVQRGLQNIADGSLGYATVGADTSAIGKAGENGVVSLGDGGTATLTFANPVFNGPGYDFAIFENGFMVDSVNAFLEFAFVEVSSDGINFFRFPAVSNTQDSVQIGLQGIDCSLVNNLAGKYVYGYGTPFDLDELRNTPRLDIDHVTHVRVIDVDGSINDLYATRDMNGRKINDPWPTPYPSSGFDLDAVGVIYADGINGVGEIPSTNSLPDGQAGKLQLNPNPSSGGEVNLTVSNDLIGGELKIFDVAGKRIDEKVVLTTNYKLETSNYSPGTYFLLIESSGNSSRAKLIVE